MLELLRDPAWGGIGVVLALGIALAPYLKRTGEKYLRSFSGDLPNRSNQTKEERKTDKPDQKPSGIDIPINKSDNFLDTQKKQAMRVFWLGLISFLIFPYIGLLAVLMGHRTLILLNKSGALRETKRWAIIGLVLGYISSLTAILVIIGIWGS